jgi:hypothetical protein
MNNQKEVLVVDGEVLTVEEMSVAEGATQAVSKAIDRGEIVTFECDYATYDFIIKSKTKYTNRKKIYGATVSTIEELVELITAVTDTLTDNNYGITCATCEYEYDGDMAAEQKTDKTEDEK